jgi:predicted GNAT family acetyltransferase
MVEVGHNENEQCYEASVDGRAAGFCQYEIEGDTVTFTHTVVRPEFEGEGVGSALAKFVLEDSRAQHRKVVPACEFINAYIRRHGEYQNLVSRS